METKNEGRVSRIGTTFHRKVSFKLLTIGALVLLLLIPRIMIMSLIRERKSNATEAIHEVMQKWSGDQTIAGPVLTIPYIEKVYDQKDDEYKDVRYEATFLPRQLDVNGDVSPKKLYRSIYDVVVYQSEISIKGAFDFPDFSKLNIAAENVLWDQARVQVGISDLRGITEEVQLEWGKHNLVFAPGVESTTICPSGISVKIPKMSEADTAGNLNFKLNLNLKGSRSLLFTPLGAKTNVKLASAWNDPCFTGNFLPANRDVNKDGFKADWTVLQFNRNFPQQWTNNNRQTNISSRQIHTADFGVELITMADHYQKNTRSAKYAILVIIIIFTVFFMSEVFSKKRIHPFQYIMIGAALTLFYLLLLSITEHLGFNLAYLIASLSVTVLIVLYCKSFMPEVKYLLITGFSLLVCFGFIFVLLQLESFALLAGSVGLFVLLAILMFATRKVNWYQE